MVNEKSETKSGIKKHLQETKSPEPLLAGKNKGLLRRSELHQSDLQAQKRELRRIKSELEAARSRYSNLFNFAPVGYFTLSQKGLIIEANPRGAEQLGCVCPQLLKTPFSLYLAKEHRLPFMTDLRRLFKEGGRRSCRLRLLRRDAAHFDAWVESILVEDPSDGPVCRMIVSEIADHPQVDGMRRDSEEKYRLLFEKNPSPMWVFDLETLAFLAVNEAAVRHYGYSREEFLSMTIKGLSPSEELPALLNEFPKRPPEDHQAGVWRHRKKDGSVIGVEITGDRISFSGRFAALVVATDMTQRLHAEAALRDSERRFRALIENSSDVIALLDAHGKIFYASPSTLRIFGYAPEALFGKTPLDLIHPDHRERAKRLFSDLLKRPEERTTTELQFRHRDGAWRWIEGIGTNLLRDPSVRAIVINYRDITDRKEAERALQEKNARIEEASRARNRFFSYMSHELKTPINSIVGFTQLLQRNTYGPLTLKQAGAVGRIHNNARELVHLINNILDLAKLESGRKGKQVMEVNLRELSERVLLSFEPLLQEKGLLLHKEIDPALSEKFLTDPMQVRSILTNLLSNAVKFTEQGEIRLRIKCCHEGKGVRLEVSDTGVGIQPEYLGRIFDEYEGSSKHSGGTGLGLAIVKKMVASLEGRIEVVSTPGQGTLFTVFLPEVSSSDEDRPRPEAL